MNNAKSVETAALCSRARIGLRLRSAGNRPAYRSLSTRRSDPSSGLDASFVFPAAQLGHEFGHRAEAGPATRLVFIGPMASLDFAFALGEPRGNVAMGDAEILEVPGESVPNFAPLNR